MITIGQFMGFEEDFREPEGWLSWQHLTYVTVIIAIAVLWGLWLGKRNRGKSIQEKKRPLRIAAVVMLVSEITKITIFCIQDGDFGIVRSNLPLFLCSIIFFTLPMAAFGKKRISDGAMNFTFVFGMLCCIAGTYLAGNIYANSPIFSYSCIASNTAHCIGGFAAVYIGSAGLAKLHRGDRWIMTLILGVFEAVALIVDILQTETSYQSNYMFFMKPDGTPFSICLDLVHGIQPLYTAFVAALYFAYLFLFILVWRLISRKNKKCIPAQDPEAEELPHS